MRSQDWLQRHIVFLGFVFTLTSVNASTQLGEGTLSPPTSPLSKKIRPAKKNIQLKSSLAHRSESALTLADFLPINEESRRLRSIFSQYSIANAPKAGEMRKFSSHLISSLIRQAQALNRTQLEKYNFTISAETEVYNPGNSIAEDEIREALLNQWKAQCSICRFEIQEIVPPRLSKKLKQVSGWRFNEVPVLPRGSFSYSIQIEGEENFPLQRARYWINGVARVLRPVPVLLRQVDFGEKLTIDDYKIEYRDTTFARDAELSADQVVGKKLRLAKAVGQVLWKGDLLQEKAIRRGEWVRVRAQEGSMIVTMMARAETDGLIGENIRLKTAEGKTTLSGVAVAKGEVDLR
ncbi:MAG: flagellar basal body P-ring formation protein FlgA [Bdellovibrionales bacterium]|nr:flagellar basal body P-ring formation protein FlgA [Bdellovibrionales bacterium]